ncbi:MAG: hypothetical protein SOU16_10690 [Faecalimonas sp.]|nr:hypothetical protein [Faecalimonas sp.]
MSRSRSGKPKVYNSKTHSTTDEDRANFECMIQMEGEKYEQDAKCGGLDGMGGYTALHKR